MLVSKEMTSCSYSMIFLYNCKPYYITWRYYILHSPFSRQKDKLPDNTLFIFSNWKPCQYTFLYYFSLVLFGTKKVYMHVSLRWTCAQLSAHQTDSQQISPYHTNKAQKERIKPNPIKKSWLIGLLFCPAQSLSLSLPFL